MIKFILRINLDEIIRLSILTKYYIMTNFNQIWEIYSYKSDIYCKEIKGGFGKYF